jgi:hypothetical protein
LLPASPTTLSDPKIGTRAHALREGLLLIVLAGLALLGIDSLIFRIGPYKTILEPDSSTGQFEMVLRRELEAQSQYGDNLVATFGDSRMAMYPREAAKAEPRTGYYLRQAGLAGTSARVWYYMLRDLDPSASRYRAIVIAVNDYDDEDVFNEAGDLRAVHFTAARLRLTDIPEFVLSFPDWRTRWEALRGSLLKGYVYQADIQEFLEDPEKRLAYVKLSAGGYPHWTWDYVEDKRNLLGLDIDFSTFNITFPPNVDQNQRDTIQNFLARRPLPQEGAMAAFRRHWMGKIVDRYRNSRTKVIFIRLPRGAIVRPDNLVKKLSSTVRDFAARPNVLLGNEHAFDELERRELFKDGLHLNNDGINRFTVLLSEEIARLLGPPAPNWQSLPDPPHDK